MRQDQRVSPRVRPPNSLLLLVGREEFVPPTSFAGAMCAATSDCIAVGVRSPDTGPTSARVVPSADGSQLAVLGEFTIESEGLVSLRDMYYREYDAMGVEPGFVHVKVLGNDASEPDDVIFVVQSVSSQRPHLPRDQGVLYGRRPNRPPPPDR
jgi:hypothetical protein